jgi:hypothetical protein
MTFFFSLERFFLCCFDTEESLVHSLKAGISSLLSKAKKEFASAGELTASC